MFAGYYKKRSSFALHVKLTGYYVGIYSIEALNLGANSKHLRRGIGACDYGDAAH